MKLILFIILVTQTLGSREINTLDQFLSLKQNSKINPWCLPNLIKYLDMLIWVGKLNKLYFFLFFLVLCYTFECSKICFWQGEGGVDLISYLYDNLGRGGSPCFGQKHIWIGCYARPEFWGLTLKTIFQCMIYIVTVLVLRK